MFVLKSILAKLTLAACLVGVSSRTRPAIGATRGGWLRVPRGGGNPPTTVAAATPAGATTPSSVGNSTSFDSAIVASNDQRETVSPAPIAAWRASLPSQLQSKGPRTLQKIRLGRTDIYLIGTAHVSNDSSTDVRLILNAVHPDCIFVELCDARIPLLEGVVEEAETVSDSNSTCANDNKSSQKPAFLERLRETQQAQGGGRMQALSTLLLTSVQEDYAKELGVELGGEFRCAHRYWKNCSSADRRPHLVLGDRPLHLTLVRAWESLRWWPKLKVVAGLLWSSLRKPNREEIRAWLESVMREETDVLTESFQELRKHFPTLYTTIISERDAWLAAKLTQTSVALSRQAPPNGEQMSMVAIVGAGHVPGICQWLTNQTTSTTARTPEDVLAELVTTKRWARDEHVQQEAIPSWIYEVRELQDNPPML